MRFISVAGFLMGIICLVYYIVIIVYAGIKATFSWFWLMAGTGCILFSIIISFMIKTGMALDRSVWIACIAMGMIGVIIFVIIESMIIIHSKQKADPGLDYLIVLGAQVRGTRITKSLQKRLDTAILYLKANPSTLAIVSGGQGPGEDISEAKAMEGYLIQHNITKDRIIKESKSTNTSENLKFSKAFLYQGNTKGAIVTNGFHIFRALRMAKKQGFQGIQGLAAPTDPVLLVNYYVREAASLLKAFVCGHLI